MKKKLLMMITVLSVAVMATACGGSSNSEKSSSNDTVKSEQAENNKKEESKAKPVDFEEMVVVDNEECTIKITGIEADNFWGYTLKAYLENKSSDKVYMFSVSNAAVNGVETDPLFATEVAAGKKVNSDISFMDTTLENIDIGDFTDIELSFRVYDSEDWSADAVADETVHVYPYGEENAVVFTREPQDSDIVLVDNEYVTAIITGFNADSIWGYTANLFFVNKTDKEVMFGTENVSVNGYMMDPFFAASVSGKKCAFASMSWMTENFEENGIKEVTDIEFLLKAYDTNDFSAAPFFNEIVTVNP